MNPVAGAHAPRRQTQPAPSASAQAPARWVRRLAPWLLAALALGLVFSLYLQPAFMVDLSNAFWACF